MAEDATPQGTPPGAADSGTPDAKPEAAATLYDDAAVASKISAAVNEAKRAWKSDTDALIADKTKDAETKLAELQTKAEEAERYADFVDEATKAGIKNCKAAYLVAKHGGFVDKKGRVDFGTFKTDNPEFFTPPPNANAGDGVGKPVTGNSMNDLIRGAISRS